VLIVGQRSFKAVADDFDRVFASEDSRSEFLAERFAGYEIFRNVANDPTWRIYQFGFEGELYYARNVVIGDVFGPGRYRDVYARAQDSAALADHLRGIGANGFMINVVREPFSVIEFDERFDDYFEPVIRTNRSVLYRLEAPRAAADQTSRTEHVDDRAV
jgi:hypothetical protein